MARGPTRAAIAALDRAQEMIYAAREAPTAGRRLALAREALAISPLCADALVIVAQAMAPGSDQELAAWRQGVEAGQAALGKDFESFAGHFWGLLETRPYMRARLGLAQALWARGARREAADHLQAMLELNPGDNQGVRYLLVVWLLHLADTAGLTAFLEAHGDEASASMLWPRALHIFQRDGQGDAARTALADAMKANKRLPPYLLGNVRLPKQLPPYYSPGDRNEAVMVAALLRPVWEATPGALDWLRAEVPAAPKRTRARPVA